MYPTIARAAVLSIELTKGGSKHYEITKSGNMFTGYLGTPEFNSRPHVYLGGHSFRGNNRCPRLYSDFQNVVLLLSNHTNKVHYYFDETIIELPPWHNLPLKTFKDLQR